MFSDKNITILTIGLTIGYVIYVAYNAYQINQTQVS